MYERLLKPRSTHKRYYKSDIVVDGDVAKITMANGLVTLVDSRFADVVAEWSWHDNGVGYARNGGNLPRMVYLHRFVLWLSGVECGDRQVDHINNDRLDNRLCNLRVVSRSENQCNRPLQNGKKYRGVRWDKRRNKYEAKLVRNRQTQFLGRFDNEIDAAKAYDRAAIAHGGVCRLNFEE